MASNTASSLTGSTGNDILAINGDVNTLYGMAGNDTLNGTWSTEYLYGGLGDDVIAGDGGNDYIDGGEGNDTIFYDSSYKSSQVKGGLGVDVLDGSNSAMAFKLDISKQFKDFEIVVGSSLNDSIIGNLADNVLYGGSGDDTLNGGRGSDTIYGGNGQDRIIYDVQDNVANIHGGNDVDTLDASSETKVGRHLDLSLYGDIENSMGGSKNDTLLGSRADNYLSGGLGADFLEGGAGDDTLYGGAGKDILWGGTGNDVIIYDAADEAANIHGNEGSDTLAAQMSANLNLNKYTDIENAAGSSKNDTLQGNGNDNILAGNGGNDRLIGNDGADVLYGDAGTDSLYGGAGDDTLIGGAGSDVLDGGDGNDVVVYDAADKAAKVKGGAGYDTLDAGLQTKQVKIDLAKSYSDFEVVIGGLSDDSLRGGSRSIELYGGDGNDVLYGGDGNDTLSGQAGSDTLIGGKGQDMYIFGAGSGDDIIARGGSNPNSEDFLRITEDAGMFTFQLVGNDMELDLASGDSLTIQGWYEQDDNKINKIIFGNDNQAYAVNIGTGADDTMVGSANDEQLYGLGGNDLLAYSGGNDVYNFNIGDGNDTIDLTASSSNGQAKIQFGTGIDRVGLKVENIGSDLLIHMSATDSLTLKDWAGNGQKISSVQLADGGKYYTTGNVGSNGFMIGDLRDNIMVGSEGNDFITALDGNDLVYGGGGNDTLYGGTGLDILLGGDGNDVICLEDINMSNDNVQLVDGGTGRDMVTAWRLGSNLGAVTIDISDETKFISIEDVAGSTHDGDTLIGNSQDNILYGKLLADTLSSGTDYFDGRDGSDTVFAYDGDDTIVYDSADTAANIHGGSGTDILDASGWTGVLDANGRQIGVNIDMAGYYHNDEDKIEQVTGSVFADSIQGTNGAEIFDGSGGDDYIDGESGNDTLIGGSGNDNLFGGAGDDTISGGSGNDSLFGGLGNDTLFGGEGSDVYYWGAKGTLSGNDVIVADNGNGYDAITFGAGMHPANLAMELKNTDLVFTTQNGDTLTLQDWSTGYEPAITKFYFQAENTWYSIDPTTLLWTIDNASYAGGITGTEDLSVHYGNDSNNTLSGNEADEIFYGGQGNESIVGGGGNDIIDGGGGSNTLSGGVGHDNYYFKLDGGNDLIVAAADTQEDAIVFANGIMPTDIEFTKNGNDLVIKYQNSDQMTIQNFYTTAQPINTFKFGAVSYNMYANDMQSSPAGTNDNSNSLVGNLENNIIIGMGGDDYLFGLDGSDILYGGDGNDYLFGYNGADYIFGGNGNDTIYYDGADKLVDGGAGRDAIFGAKKINLSNDDQFINIEDIIGSGNDDDLTGSADDNRIWGYSGADTLDGAVGNDSIWGGNVYLPDVPADNSSSSYPNTMSNDAMIDDVIIFDKQASSEYISGGGGADILDASQETSGVTINLTDSSKYNSIEFVTGGSGDDYIYGGNTTYTGYFWDGITGDIPTLVQTELNWTHKLAGGAGSDTLDAGAGNDDFTRINFLELNYGAGLGQQAYDLLYSDHLSGNGDYMEADWHGNEIIHTADTLVGGTGRDFYVFGHGYGNDMIASDSQNCEDVIWLNNDIVVTAGQDLNDILLVTLSGSNGKDMVISIVDGKYDSHNDSADYYAVTDAVALRALVDANPHLTITDGAVDYNHAILQFNVMVDEGGVLSRQYYVLTPGAPGGFTFHSID